MQLHWHPTCSESAGREIFFLNATHNYPVFTFKRNALASHELSLPDELWNVPNPPEELYVQGTVEALSLLDSLPHLGFAVVGTREPQARSLSLVKKQIRLLASSPLIIISGFASGTDAAAHEAALDEGLSTIGILGGGLDRVYPRENLLLRERILSAGGLLISEFPLGSDALPHQFLLRNRLIAAWSRATWVVEASHRSGALNTAKWARILDRMCFATPCFPGDPTLAGNQTLIDRDFALPLWGAHSLGAAWLELATLAEEVPPLLKLLKPTKTTHSDALAAQIHNLSLSDGGTQIQFLLDWALESGWKPAEFFAALSDIERSGQILQLDGTVLSQFRPS